MPAHFAIGCAYLWRRGTSFSEKKRFSRRRQNLVASVSKLQSLNQTRLKQTFCRKNVCEDFTFAMMIKMLTLYVVGGPKGEKPRISWVLWGSSHFSDSQHLPTSPNLQKMCIWVSYNIPPNFKSKYWQDNFVWEKLKYPLGGWAVFRIYFWP